MFARYSVIKEAVPGTILADLGQIKPLKVINTTRWLVAVGMVYIRRARVEKQQQGGWSW